MLIANLGLTLGLNNRSLTESRKMVLKTTDKGFFGHLMFADS